MQIVHWKEEAYPIQLQGIQQPPKQLYIEGDANLLHKDAIAVIGSRNHTLWGEQITKEFVKAFVKSGLVIVSGMAKGIDSIAHEVCLQHGGRTVAVLGCGIEAIPTEQQEIYSKILEGKGAILSEYEPKEEVKSIHFPARNRIVSGLCRGVFVVEAAYRSGTSITAKFAMQQGKPVYCLPQEREATKGVGTNHLLQIGAKLVTTPEEILKDLGKLENTVEPAGIEEVFTQEEQEIFEELQKGNRTPTMLSIALKKPIFQIQSRLMKMELEEKIRKDSKGRYIRNE